MTLQIVLGPPGTGKTTTLLNRVDEELVAGTPPDRIAYVSFTKRAAQEAIDRACARFNLQRDQLPYFRTLHSLCFRALGMRRSDVFDGKPVQEFADHVGVRVTGRWSEDGTLTGFDLGDRILFMENLARMRGIPLRQQYDMDDDNLPWDEVDRVARGLREFKRKRGLMDYTDMLLEFAKTEHSLGLQVVIVDEGQDQSRAQWRAVDLLTRGARRTMVAGDDDQAIYKWAGADVDYLIDLPGDSRVLGQSYRVPPAIQAVAGGIIRHVRHRRPKEWAGRVGEDGFVDREPSFENVDCDGADVLVLARNTYVLRDQVEPELRGRGIIYERNGHPSVRPTLLEAIETWEALRAGQAVEVSAARRVYEQMSAGTGVQRGYKRLPDFGDDEPVTLDLLTKKGGLMTNAIWHEALDRLPRGEVDYIVRARKRGESLRRRPRVRLSTIHSAKGGEADHVIVMREMARRTYNEMERNPEDEARVWYVAATRARKRLTVVDGQTRQEYPWL